MSKESYAPVSNLISYIYSQNDKPIPLNFEDLVKDEESKEFAIYAFASVLETIELMEDY